VCQNENELLKAAEIAVTFLKTHQVIVEEFVEGCFLLST
jgi:hypothetical protein